jgi:hypothetical protein
LPPPACLVGMRRAAIAVGREVRRPGGASRNIRAAAVGDSLTDSATRGVVSAAGAVAVVSGFVLRAADPCTDSTPGRTLGHPQLCRGWSARRQLYVYSYKGPR